MAYSYLNDYAFTYVDDPVIEPVTVAEAKLYCRVTNTIEDDLFTELIIQSREAIEKVTNLSLVQKNLIVCFNNLGGNFELPFGPIVRASFKLYDDNQNGAEIASGFYKTIGIQYLKLEYPAYQNLRATYYGGYSEIPKELKIAMLDQINYGYENRGMDVNDMGICEKTWRACQRWTRTSPIL